MALTAVLAIAVAKLCATHKHLCSCRRALRRPGGITPHYNEGGGGAAATAAEHTELKVRATAGGVMT